MKMNRNIKQYIKRILVFPLSAILALSMPICTFSEGNASKTSFMESEDTSAPSPEGNDSYIQAALLAENAVHISSTEDFIQFSRNCSDDAWSQEKVFILDTDIDLIGIDFSPVPTFGGIFLGQEHTISGLSLNGGSNNMGLFRYIQEKGEIYQLSVSGNAQAKESHSGLALLAGCNYGLISGCSVSGNITGGKQTGGIAGLNELTGIITDCQAGGTVNGRHLAGGIAGENKGTITNCTNQSFVNTTPDDNKIDLSSLDILSADASLTDLLTTENAASVTDIGGISGNNSGIIRACTNEGSIGYPHVGYNIGGISGSQTGYIEGCVNHGTLNGRKDIGGIAGQMEPSSELEFSEDMLARLDTEFDKLHDLLTRLDNDARGSSEALTGQVDVLLTSVENAQHAVDEIVTGVGNHLNDFASLTDLASLPSPKPVSLNFLDDLDGLDDLEMPSLPSVSPWPFPTYSPGSSPTSAPTPLTTPTAAPAATPTAAPTPGKKENDGNAINSITEETENNTQDDITTASFTPAILWSQPLEAGTVEVLTNEDTDTAPIDTSNALPLKEQNSTANGIETDETIPQVNADTPTQTPVIQATPIPTPTHNPYAAGWADGFSTYPMNADSLKSRINRERVEDDINEVQENLYEDASHVLEKLQSIVQNQASVLSERVYAAQNSLSGSVIAVITDTRTLNNMLDDENQLLLDDIQAIIDEIHVISNIITEPETIDPDEVLADVSDEDSLTDTTGKVMNCINNGKINGDINAGGIAGTLSRENNLDPENDFDLNNATLNFRYKERIVVRKCQNTGTVTSKKDRAGGIAGEMALGSIIDCTNTGSVNSEDGDMVGGIAGYSASTVRLSNAKCSLSGKNQIGGITGYGTSISDCYSMVQILEGESYLGSVAGRTDSVDNVSNNYFVEGCPAGIDGISYQGKAQALSYEDFESKEDLPDMFRQIYLTFTADDKLVATIPLNYGDTFSPDQLPRVPEKEGYIGRWEDFDTASITFDHKIQAVYTEYITTLESSQMVGTRPILLLEGRFAPENTLTLLSVNAYPEDAQTKAECWKLSLSGNSKGPYVIRCLIPTDMEAPRLELYKDSAWQPIDTIIDGSYFVFTSDKPDIIFSCVDRPEAVDTVTVIFAGICTVLFIFASIVLHRRKRSLRHSKKKITP